MKRSDQPQMKTGAIAKPEAWLEEWVEPVLARYPEIEQVFLLGDRARGPQGQKPDYSLLFYAGYDQALELMTSLAREETQLRPSEGILHLYVENYGATFCGIWGGALIPNEYNRTWEEGHDYQLWKECKQGALPLGQRLRLPLDRRRSERRRETDLQERDQLQPLWPDSKVGERRFVERRRNFDGLVPLLNEAQ